MISEEFIKKQLRAIDASPNKIMGQHFLRDTDCINQMIASADLRAVDTIIEIGPGLGILTDALVKTGKRVIAVEKDRAFSNSLTQKFKNTKGVIIVNGDILETNLELLVKDAGNYSIISNLPYNITARFMRLFLSDTAKKPKEIVVMIQQEVAKRMVAKRGDFTKLALLVQVYGDPSIIIEDILPDSFYPKPKVTSAVIFIHLKSQPLSIFPQYEDVFWRLIRIGFASKRKMLSNNLRAGFHIEAKEVRKLLTLAHIKESSRAEELDIKDWVALVDIYNKNHCR